jgi:hypothetical protein
LPSPSKGLEEQGKKIHALSHLEEESGNAQQKLGLVEESDLKGFD